MAKIMLFPGIIKNHSILMPSCYLESNLCHFHGFHASRHPELRTKDIKVCVNANWLLVSAKNDLPSRNEYIYFIKLRPTFNKI